MQNMREAIDIVLAMKCEGSCYGVNQEHCDVLDEVVEELTNANL